MSEPRVLKQLTQPLLEQIHPSLRDSFTALPPLGTQMNGYLQQMLEQNTTHIFSEEINTRTNLHSRLDKLMEEIALLEEQARTLIRRQASAGEELQSLYDDELNQINARLRNMRATRVALQAQTIADQQAETMQLVTLEELASITLDAFWKQESRYINQMLYRLMSRLLGLNGELVGVAEVNLHLVPTDLITSRDGRFCRLRASL